MKRCMTWVVLSTAALALQAQVPDQMRQATISGSQGTWGKCTIEVRVETAAEVDVYGNSGRLQTVAGPPATRTRTECTAGLPSRMSDFRFKGVDGRSNVQLAQDPRNNDGMAVTRIDDPRAGSEGYTFDTEWSGAPAGTPTSGFPTGGYYPSTSGTYPATTSSRDTGNTGVLSPNRRLGRTMSAETAIDLCRAEVHARAERDYNLRNVDIVAVAVDVSAGRRDWATGSFYDRSTGYFRAGGGYRFHCAMDYNSGQVRTVEILRADGSAMQTGTYRRIAIPDRVRPGAFRACQDAVVSRAARDGYQNVSFSSTVVDTTRSGRIAGAITANRGPVSDTFDFGCFMDLGTATVRNLELNRR